MKERKFLRGVVATAGLTLLAGGALDNAAGDRKQNASAVAASIIEDAQYRLSNDDYDPNIPLAQELLVRAGNRMEKDGISTASLYKIAGKNLSSRHDDLDGVNRDLDSVVDSLKGQGERQSKRGKIIAANGGVLFIVPIFRRLSASK